MASVWSLAQERPADKPAAQPRDKGLFTLTYRSRAAAPFSEAGLSLLLQSAQARNHAEGITGLLIYDEGRFFQWLEGPADSLARVWQSIRRDVRHTDIELLGEARAAARLFGDWTLKLAKRLLPPGDTPRDALGVPAELIATLYQRPEAAPALFTTLAPAGAHRAPLAGVLSQLVIPQLVARHTARPQALPAAHPRAAELARLLVAADPANAFTLIDGLLASAGSLGRLCASVLEPAARGLGDLWGADECSEWDVTLGLCRLQTALRRRPSAPVAAMALPPPQRAVLVAPQPGEPHMLGAALDAEILWQAGWDTHCEHPATDGALEDLVAGTWFDALDLSLSLAFQREHWLPRMAATIAGVRKASRNPALVVVVGGRLFFDQQSAGQRVGADAGHATAQQVSALMPRRAAQA